VDAARDLSCVDVKGRDDAGGRGIRSRKVEMRQIPGFVCVRARPVRYFQGSSLPVREPEKMAGGGISGSTGRRVYSGLLEWKSGTP